MNAARLIHKFAWQFSANLDFLLTKFLAFAGATFLANSELPNLWLLTSVETHS